MFSGLFHVWACRSLLSHLVSDPLLFQQYKYRKKILHYQRKMQKKNKLKKPGKKFGSSDFFAIFVR